MTVQQLITEHLDIWTAAHKTRSSAGRGSSNKLNLVGIKKLRELILELAVCGKLVPQDPNDEPASELLEVIRTEKNKLAKEGKLKKGKALQPISDEEKPFELPSGWEFVRLQSIASVMAGNSFKSEDFSSEGGARVIKITNAGVGEFVETDDYLPFDFIHTASQYLVFEGDFILALTRPYISDGLKISRCPASYHNSLLNQRVAAIRINPLMTSEYFYQFFRSYFVLGVYLNRFGGSGLQPNLKMSDVTGLIFAVPPKEEQHRIVAKVDELMAFCDQLEQAQTNNIAAHAQLVEALLATLVDSTDHKALQSNWQRIAAHFDTLFTTEHSIDQLKQTILQLAVMGKLVPQNPTDEPASELLKKIALEKAQLIKEGKIKKQKPLPEIMEEEKPFELPIGWEWERLSIISDVGTGATPSRTNSAYFEPAEVSWVTSGETSQEYVRETKEKVSWKAIKETNVSVYPAGTLIIAMYGQGKTRGQITELLIEAGTNQACAAIRLVENSVHHRKYVKLFFIKAYDELREHSAGGAQPNLNVGKVSTTVIPLPPLAEQHRIVTKVEQLMTLCDTLKTNLQTAQTTQLGLAESLVEQAVN